MPMMIWIDANSQLLTLVQPIILELGNHFDTHRIALESLKPYLTDIADRSFKFRAIGSLTERTFFLWLASV